MSNTPTRIAVTGMGAVTPFGNGVETFWKACLEGKSGLGPLTCFDTEGFQFTRGGQVPDCDPPPEIDRASFLMQTAAREAFTDAALQPATQTVQDAAVVLATNFGGACSGENLFADLGDGHVDTGIASEYQMSTCAQRIGSHLGLAGPRTMLSMSCASGAATICHGADLIRMGHADIVLVGGYDALSRFAWAGLSALRAMTKDEVRPFDKDRGGTIFSEGAGALILENMTHAKQRQATIHAEVLGGWMNNNAFHLTAPAKEGAGSAMVMKRALEQASVTPDTVDHIDAHGTGTKYNDVTETQAIKSVFGDHARCLSVTSIKAMTGHLMGAAGAVESISAILTMKHGVIPPTINYQTPDPECDLDYVTNTAREAEIKTVLSNSAGIGGCNAAVVLQRGDASE